MPTTRAAALAALLGAASVLLPAPHLVRRDDGLPRDIPADGALVELGDGVVEVLPLLSPPLFEITLTAEISLSADTRETLDAAVAALAALVADGADRTLGGLIDGLEFGEPSFATVAEMGDEATPLPPFHDAQVPVRLFYLATSPLG